MRYKRYETDVCFKSTARDIQIMAYISKGILKGVAQPQSVYAFWSLPVSFSLARLSKQKCNKYFVHIFTPLLVSICVGHYKISVPDGMYFYVKS